MVTTYDENCGSARVCTNYHTHDHTHYRAQYHTHTITRTITHTITRTITHTITRTIPHAPAYRGDLALVAVGDLERTILAIGSVEVGVGLVNAPGAGGGQAPLRRCRSRLARNAGGEA